MSASEKLRALNDATPLEKYEIDLFSFLPQIVAVVEAATFALPVLQEYSIGADEQGHQTAASQMHEAHEVLVSALAALDEALGSTES